MASVSSGSFKDFMKENYNPTCLNDSKCNYIQSEINAFSVLCNCMN